MQYCQVTETESCTSEIIGLAPCASLLPFRNKKSLMKKSNTLQLVKQYELFIFVIGKETGTAYVWLLSRKLGCNTSCFYI